MISAPERSELTFTDALAFIVRHWRLIGLSTLAGASLSILIVKTSPKVWEGSFLIDTSNSDSAGGIGGLMPGGNPNIALNSLRSSSKAMSIVLNTDIQILKSESILRPVFDKLIGQSNDLALKEQDFNNWSNDISIDIVDETSILKVAFISPQRASIIPTLNGLLGAAKSYSSRDRVKSLDSSIKYTSSQYDKYKKQADSSLKELNSYSLKYGIAVDNGQSTSSESFDLRDSPIPVGRSSSSNNFSTPPIQELSEINKELAIRRKTFKDTDPSIKRLLRRRDALQTYLESSAAGSVIYSGKQVTTKEEAQEILLKYQELQSASDRDQSTLSSLADALRSLNLEKVRSVTPWEVVARPAISDSPVKPQPVRLLLFGLFSGLGLGFIIGFLKDLIHNKIYRSSNLESIIPFARLANLSARSHTDWGEFADLYISNFLGSGETIALHSPSGTSSNIVNLMIQAFRKHGLDNVTAKTSLADCSKYNKVLILIEQGKCTTECIEQLCDMAKIEGRLSDFHWVWVTN